MDIGAVIVVLLGNQLRRVHMVDPRRHIRHVVVATLARHRVYQHRADGIRAAEETDRLLHPRADPPRVALLVDLKGGIVEEVGGVVETEVAAEVAAEVLGGRIADALLETDDIDVLRDHVNHEIGGQTRLAVVEPLDPVAVAQRRHADGAVFVVDLRVVVCDLELRDHVRQLAELAVAETGRRVAVEHRDLVEADLVDLVGEAACLNGQQVAVSARAQHLPAEHRTDQRHSHEQRRREERHAALLLHKAEVALRPFALKAGGQHRAHAVHRAQQQRKDVELRRLQADRRQHGIEVDQPEHQRHRQIDERPPERRADGFSDLLRPGRAPARPGEALKIRVVPVDIHISVLSASGEALAIVPIIPDLGRDVQQFWVAQGRFANHSRNRRLTGPRS